MNGYTSRGSDSANLIFASLFNGGSTLEGKNLLLQKQSLFFKSRPDFERELSSTASTMKSQKGFSFVKMAEKYRDVPSQSSR